ncbi:hypothetical protein Y1Q_0015254 [Alligator mississippiensis]|uniref:Ig-like domain-containing protein n=1 Tax=Alligator mississippiensis TaxID=8496 RepID=A0A151NL37_ALLMI|nr:hypothetical protein Y1Q_0015254 [Alligator mississippiensis]
MGTWAFVCMACCLLAVRLLDARISQMQSLVLKKGDSAQLKCEQTDGHYAMFWYRQDLGQGLLDARISQTQSLVLKKGGLALLECEQTDGHYAMFWYQQDVGQGPLLPQLLLLPAPCKAPPPRKTLPPVLAGLDSGVGLVSAADAMWLVLGVSCGLQLLAGLCTGVTVTQKKFIAIMNRTTASLPCEHDDSNKYAILWYQQQKGAGGELEFVAQQITGNEAEIEAKFKERFKWKQTNTFKSSLDIMCPVKQMWTRLLWCVACCLLSVRLLDARITQTQSLVLRKGGTAQLQCEQTYGHDGMFWYRQDLDQGPQLLFYFYYGKETEKGNIPDRFTAKMAGAKVLRLNISAVESQDSAVYFCASSEDTAHYKAPPARKSQNSLLCGRHCALVLVYAADTMWLVLGVSCGLQLLAGLCSGVTVTQKKKFIAIQNGTNAILPCEHNDNKYFTILWYRQKAGAGGELEFVASADTGLYHLCQPRGKCCTGSPAPVTAAPLLRIASLP